MFYEARIKNVKEHQSLSELIEDISSCFYYEVLHTVKVDNTLYGFANDQTNCEGGLEVAVLNLSEGIQFESVTLSWLESDPHQYFSDLLSRTDHYMRKTLKFSITGSSIIHHQEKPQAHFECGCCGRGFQSDYDYQLKFGQDAGYGLCDRCE